MHTPEHWKVMPRLNVPLLEGDVRRVCTVSVSLPKVCPVAGVAATASELVLVIGELFRVKLSRPVPPVIMLTKEH